LPHVYSPTPPLEKLYPIMNGQTDELEEWKPPANLFELSNSISLESRVYEAGLILKRAMQIRSPHLIKERRVQRSVCLKNFFIILI
jgi:hypothetical protein